jgi:hypothetical protein
LVRVPVFPLSFPDITITSSPVFNLLIRLPLVLEKLFS